jgi:hypothetical protein
VVVEEAGGGALTVVLLAGGAVNVCVVVAVVPAALLEVLVVDVDVALALAFRGGTGTAVPGRATVACAPVAGSLAASAPACAGCEVDFTALPIPKPAAIAITINAPSSNHRRSMFPPSLRPVPGPIVMGVSSLWATPGTSG